MTEARGKLFLLDAYALIFRAYYAFINRHMYNSSGLNTSAIFGFTVTLDEILKKEDPTHIAVVFDPPGPNFRHEMYTEYKANRDETPEDIKKAIPIIKDVIKAFNIPVIEVKGYEADDVIGTLSKKAEKSGLLTYMMTPDKDYTQLVSENIFMYKPRKGGGEAEIIGVEEVMAKFEVKHPEQVIDILALWGDSSDNVPGAPGIGEKTAKKLVSEFGTLESIFENSDRLKGKQKESIENNIDQIKLSKELVTIDLDVPVEFSEDQLKRRNPDVEKLKILFKDLEFRTITERIIGKGTLNEEKPVQTDDQGSLFSSETGQSIRQEEYSSIHTTTHAYHCVKEEKDIDHLITELSSCKAFCFDTETTHINALEAELVGIAFSYKEHEAWYVPFPSEPAARDLLLSRFKEVFANPEIGKTGQNIKYDIQVLENYQLHVRGEIFDTMIAHYLVHPDAPHNLDYLSLTFLEYKPVSIEELIGTKGQNQKNMRDVPEETIKDYACEDADLTWQLSRILLKELVDSNLDKLARDIEFPLIPVLAAMERAGFVLDTDSMEQYGTNLTSDLIKLEEEIFELAGEKFNVSSPKQLGIILFEKLKISEQTRKTKSKQYSTNEEVLSRLVDKHPIVDKVMDFRTLKKLLSTYVEALPKMINPETGKIHSSFNQAITATGRLSSNNPNLQNIPIREQRGREIRKAFIPQASNNRIISADYSQIELRLIAHMSNDENLIEAFVNLEDIHTATAAKIFSIPLEEVSREMRGQAKTANFGIIYGISAFGLSQRLRISRSDAKELIDGYFKSYPKVKEYMDQSISRARESGFVQTILGRKRYLPDILSRNSVVRGFAERNAINAPIQGSAADIIKIAMININKRIEDVQLTGKMILQVHDELIFDIPATEEEEFNNLIRLEMENALTLNVPLLVEIGSGNNWFEAH